MDEAYAVLVVITQVWFHSGDERPGLWVGSFRQNGRKTEYDTYHLPLILRDPFIYFRRLLAFLIVSIDILKNGGQRHEQASTRGVVQTAMYASRSAIIGYRGTRITLQRARAV
jgi:hypothetical protein